MKSFTDGFCVLAGNRPWPTRKPHYIYYYFDVVRHDVLLRERA